MLSNEENYCPNCGQQNRDQRVSISVFIQDFISNYISFDTTFFRTVKPFFFKPGKLTLEFNAGKRNFYIHPIRLYLIFSLFYFFIVSLNVPTNAVDTVMNELLSSSGRKASLAAMDSTDRIELERVLGERSLPGFMSEQSSDTLANTSGDSSRNYTKWAYIKASAIDNEVSDSTFNTLISGQSGEFLSSFSISKKRSFVANSNLYLTNALRNLPIMMFILLPLFALLLMLLHLKNKQFFIEHLIHALHLHAFAYFLYGIGIILMFNFEKISGGVFFICFVIVSLYAFLSFLRVYKNDFMKALLKFIILGFFYFMLLMTAVGLELYISLLTL